MLLYEVVAYTIHKKCKKSYKNVEFKESAIAWNEKLHGELYLRYLRLF